MIKGIGVVYYHVNNQEQSTKWYKDVLGLEVGPSWPGWQEFKIPGNVRFAIDAPKGELSEMETTPNAVVSFIMDDIKATVEQLQEKGVKLYGQVMEFPHATVATKQDPDENFTQLLQEK